ncbi:hypothetical protein E2C01_016801 [Portunus trituberculatus]|uniref:Uncharacterized protein n=1 Tax=Portunus trituberculatus TaxID=210409 RepID=A0A5B7DQR7_PORTR|nr:hypothetical protein [Portunus trituberculatus]
MPCWRNILEYRQSYRVQICTGPPGVVLLRHQVGGLQVRADRQVRAAPGQADARQASFCEARRRCRRPVGLIRFPPTVLVSYEAHIPSPPVLPRPSVRAGESTRSSTPLFPTPTLPARGAPPHCCQRKAPQLQHRRRVRLPVMKFRRRRVIVVSLVTMTTSTNESWCR